MQMIKRAPQNRDLKIFAVSVIVQRETGGNLVEILEKLAETIRGRYQFYEKLSALSAEGKLSGCAGRAAGGHRARPHVRQPRVHVVAVHHAMGHTIMVYAVGSWLFGMFWLRQMGKVEL